MRHIRLSGLGMAAAIAAVASISQSPLSAPIASRVNRHNQKPADEKESRQRKRWLQKQARKNMRRHAK